MSIKIRAKDYNTFYDEKIVIEIPAYEVEKIDEVIKLFGGLAFADAGNSITDFASDVLYRWRKKLEKAITKHG